MLGPSPLAIALRLDPCMHTTVAGLRSGLSRLLTAKALLLLGLAIAIRGTSIACEPNIRALFVGPSGLLIRRLTFVELLTDSFRGPSRTLPVSVVIILQPCRIAGCALTLPGPVSTCG